jgi:hypothetical protein
LVALLVVVAVAAGVRRADARPAPVPVVPATKVSVINDPRITESSGLAASRAHPGIAYTVNDSGHSPQVFAIDINSGNVVGVTTVSGVHWQDTEAMGLANGKLWVGDVGNNELNRKDAALYELDEPGFGDHRVRATRFPVTLKGMPADVESMAILPSGRIDLYVKGWPAGYALELNAAQLRPDRQNVAPTTNRAAPMFASDATVTPDGRYVLIRNSVMVEVHDAATWQVVHRDAIPVQDRGETITMEPSGDSYLIGSEGEDSPLLRVAFNPSSWGNGAIPVIDSRTQAEAQEPVRLFLWDHQRAIVVIAGLSVLALGGLAVRMVRRRARR